MQICFFEDDTCICFHPLTLTRPVDDLRIGIFTIAEKWCRALDKETWTSFSRLELEHLFSRPETDSSTSTLWINSRYLPSQDFLAKVKDLSQGTCIRHDNTVMAAHVDEQTTESWIKNGKPDFNALLVVQASALKCIKNLWDLFLMNGDEIRADIKLLTATSSNDISLSPKAILENEEDIYIDKNATIEAGAIIIADEGPVYIGPGATIMAGALIKGPVAICEDSTIKMGAKIYPDTTIGPVCKVGGEISNSIFHSYSNKGHDGYVGNSLIGQWCNLGADTNTSNLKNNYSTIHITDWKSREEIETGQQFLGTVMGDHTKTAINSQLNTGTICGVSCNIFAGDFPPKLIPSFSWVGSNVIQPYKLEKAMDAMKAMMSRRNVELTEDYKQLMRHIFKQEHG